MAEPRPSVLKRVELAGRRLLTALLGHLIGTRPRALTEIHRILVVRLDERVGNLVMLTPLLETLRRRYPAAELDVLGNERGRALLAAHPAVSAFIGFRKRALFASDGPLRTPVALRRRRYDLAIDASNPSDPSFTQAALVALSGARTTLGSTARGHGPFFSHPTDPKGEHEIALRLSLLAPLGVGTQVELPSLAQFPTPREELTRFLGEVPPVVLNLGARLTHKQLSVDDYAALARGAEGRRLLLTWGPKERPLAEAVASRCAHAEVAPSTTLADLGWVFSKAACVISCDTGPMHVAVAVGTPTLGVFVATEPERFGYSVPPHAIIDARDSRGDLEERARIWVAGLEEVEPTPIACAQTERSS